MKCELVQVGRELLVELAGDLDVVHAEELADALEEAERRSTHLVLDLQNVSFIDGTALGSLVGSSRRLRERGGDLQVLVSSPHILRALRVTNVDSVVMVVDKSSTVSAHPSGS